MGNASKSTAKAKRKQKAPSKRSGTRGTPKNARAIEQERVEAETNPAFTEDWMADFIAHLAEGGHVVGACELARIGRSTAYRHRQRDEAFAVAWADAEEAGTEKLEEEAIRRARDGVDEPVFYEGEEIGTVRKYSDTLLIFILKARKPEKYRDRLDLRHSGTVRPPRVDLSVLSKADLDKYEELSAKLAAATKQEA